MNKPNVSEQIDARKNGLAPSQLNRQKSQSGAWDWRTVKHQHHKRTL